MESLKSQTLQSFEALIVDDGSSDGTLNYLEQLTDIDSRFRVVKKKGAHGACASRNAAIAAARGKYVTGLDDDDWFHPNRLAFFLKNWDSGYSAISTNHYSVYEKNQKRRSFIGRVVHLEDMMFFNLVGSQVFTLRQRIEEVGGFDESLSASQDYDLWIRLIEKFGPIRRFRQPLYFMDSSRGRKRISTTSCRDEGTIQFITKHKSKMTKEQLLHHNKKRSNSVPSPLPQKIRNIDRFGHRYLIEKIRRILMLG